VFELVIYYATGRAIDYASELATDCVIDCDRAHHCDPTTDCVNDRGHGSSWNSAAEMPELPWMGDLYIRLAQLPNQTVEWAVLSAAFREHRFRLPKISC
jgi:hypothetical protein